MADRIAITQLLSFKEDVALYSIRESQVALLEYHLSRDPLLGRPVVGEQGLRELEFAGHRVVYYPADNFSLIVLLQIRPPQVAEPKLMTSARKWILRTLSVLTREGLKKWLGL
ncbi:MAG: hypothetical protein H6891_04985 [Brucellaceae bacterium]|nr:hypothetical protein [Brucellaceae bacterium]